jgi:hypothetical protein
MAQYRLGQSGAYVVANGHPLPRRFGANEIIEVADDLVPGIAWEPLDAAAEIAWEKRHQYLNCKPAPNGVQMIDRESGRVRVPRIEGGRPR